MSLRPPLTEARIRNILAMLESLMSRANKRARLFLSHPELFDISKPPLELLGPRFLAVVTEESGNAADFVRDYYWLISIYYYVKNGGVASTLEAARRLTEEEWWMSRLSNRKSRALRLRQARGWAEAARRKVTLLEQVTEAEEQAVRRCFFEIEKATGFSVGREKALSEWDKHFGPAS